MNPTVHKLTYEDEKQLTWQQETGMLYAKLRIYYMLRAFVEDNEILRNGHKGYLSHLYTEELLMKQKSENEQQKKYKQLQKSFSRKLKSIDRLLRLFPQIITMEKEDIKYLLEVGE